MAKERSLGVNADPFKAAPSNAAKLRASAARAPKGVNPQAVANAAILASKKTTIRYQNGRTLPASAERLLADARRKDLKHSGILDDNMRAAAVSRPETGVAAHHIVAWQMPRAFPSQELLFSWGIGINDTDNGVYLPRFKSTVVESLPHARKHSGLHTYVYHSEVYARLVDIPGEREHSESGREALRGIKADLIAGTFPYLEEHLV